MNELSLPTPFATTAPVEVRRVANGKARSLFRRSTIRTRLTIAFLVIGAIAGFRSVYRLGSRPTSVSKSDPKRD